MKTATTDQEFSKTVNKVFDISDMHLIFVGC